MGNNYPIGIFDSGVGGLSVLRWLRYKLPNENLIYVADSCYAPYGDKSREFIEERSVSLTRFLMGQRSKAIVVACNTATAAAISTLRSMFPIPIIGVEPGIKPALSATKNGTIGILATRETLKSNKFKNLVELLCKDHNAVTQECPGLVELVEQTDLSGRQTYELVAKYVNALISKGADTLVLGCTHYSFLAHIIQSIAGEDILIVDTGEAVAREVVRRLGEAKLISESNEEGNEVFLTSGKPERVGAVIDRIWGEAVMVEVLPEAYRSSSL